MTGRSSRPSAARSRPGVAAFLRGVSAEIPEGADPGVRAHVQRAIAETLASGTLEPVGELGPLEKRSLLAALDHQLRRRAYHGDPKMVVELTVQLMAPLHGDRAPEIVPPAPAR